MAKRSVFQTEDEGSSPSTYIKNTIKGGLRPWGFTQAKGRQSPTPYILPKSFFWAKVQAPPSRAFDKITGFQRNRAAFSYGGRASSPPSGRAP